MRLSLISILLLSLVAGCSSIKIGPHRIDVQQGNALDQENVSRLKPGLNRSQVRFLLGTPLVVDPFRTDRWDYVYVFYQAGKLAEQKRITLFFDGDTLVRIEGDVPAAVREAQAAADATKVVAEAKPAAATPATPATPAEQPATAPVARTASTESSVVPPLPSPKNAPAYVDPRPPAELSLQPETDGTKIKPDVTPSLPETHSANSGDDAPVLKALNAWASAWSRLDEEAYLAAYDVSFVPQGGRSHAEWVASRRLLLGVTKNIDLKIESPSVELGADGLATVTFNQFYQSDGYRDAVVKQLRMIERDGRWLIVEEKVLTPLRGSKP